MPSEYGNWRAALTNLSAAVERARGGEPEHPQAPAPDPSETAPATVMVVDDERDIRFLLRFVLEKAGYRVVEAVHGASAMEMIRNESPSLVITDLMMPVMDGGELIEFLRASEKTAHIPVILASACPERAPVDRFDHVMRKPFTPREITEVVKQVLQRTPR